jgi:hypothetical protein
MAENDAYYSVHVQICGVIYMPLRHFICKELFNSVFQFVAMFYYKIFTSVMTLLEFAASCEKSGVMRPYCYWFYAFNMCFMFRSGHCFTLNI